MAATKAPKATKAEGSERKGTPRPSAVISDLDFGGVDPARLAATSARRTAWDDTLDSLYDATAKGLVGRDGEGKLKFVKIGSYSSTQGARSQVKAFTNRGHAKTYEFKVSGNDLFARVIELPDTDEAEG